MDNTAIAKQNGTAQKSLAVINEYPDSKYNRLIPYTSIEKVNPYLNYRIVEVKISGDPARRQVYELREKGAEGKPLYAFTKVGLMMLASAAGIRWKSSRRTDDGKNPLIARVQVMGEMQGLDGRWYPMPGEKEINIERYLAMERLRLVAAGTDPAKVEQQAASNVLRAYGKRIEHLAEQTETMAMERAIRAHLSLKPGYTKDELDKPFIMVRPEVDIQAHPAFKHALETVAAGYIAEMFGGEGPAKREIVAGEQVLALAEGAQAFGDELVDEDTGEILDATAIPGDLAANAIPEVHEEGANAADLRAKIEQLIPLAKTNMATVQKWCKDHFNTSFEEAGIDGLTELQQKLAEMAAQKQKAA